MNICYYQVENLYNMHLFVILIIYIIITYVLVTPLSSKLINMHKGNYRSGLLPLLGAGVGGGGPGGGRW